MDGAGALLEIDVSMRGDTLPLELSGAIDLSTVEVVRQALDTGAASAARSVVVGVTRLTFISCDGARCLLEAKAAAAMRDRTLEIVGGSAIVKRVLTILDEPGAEVLRL